MKDNSANTLLYTNTVHKVYKVYTYLVTDILYPKNSLRKAML